MVGKDRPLLRKRENFYLETGSHYYPVIVLDISHWHTNYDSINISETEILLSSCLRC
jgi:hypothetical protein